MKRELQFGHRNSERVASHESEILVVKRCHSELTLTSVQNPVLKVGFEIAQGKTKICFKCPELCVLFQIISDMQIYFIYPLMFQG